MTAFLTKYGITLLIFLVLDGLWLGLIAKNFYGKHLGFLMKDPITWWAALVFYVLFAVGLVVFVIEPGMKTSLGSVALKGALFGLIAYATYDLTNHATIQNWPWIVTAVDLCWGAFIGCATCTASVWVIQNIIQKA